MNRFQICYDIYDSGYLVHTNSSDLRFPLRVRFFFTSSIMLASVTLGVLHGLCVSRVGEKACLHKSILTLFSVCVKKIGCCKNCNDYKMIIIRQ